jgi:hypothetical protein
LRTFFRNKKIKLCWRKRLNLFNLSLSLIYINTPPLLIMKKLKVILIAATALVLFATSSNAQVVVKKKMVEHYLVMYRPPRPSEKHFWVDGEWVPHENTYVEVPAHWAIAPHPHALWVGGEWKRHKGGYIWLPGTWK